MLVSARQIFTGSKQGPQTRFSLRLANVYEAANGLVAPSPVDMRYFTMSAWCRFDSSSRPRLGVIGMRSAPGIYPTEYGLTITSPDSAHRAVYSIVADAIGWGDNLCPVVDTKWHYVAVTIDDGVENFYLDGVRKAGATLRPAPGGRYILGQGRDYNRSYGNVTRGCWWNRVLTAAEVADDYARGAKTPSSRGLVCYCPLSSDTLVDEVSGGTFTLCAGTSMSNETPWS